MYTCWRRQGNVAGCFDGSGILRASDAHSRVIRHRQLHLALDDEGSKAVKYTTVPLLKLMRFDTITQRHII